MKFDASQFEIRLARTETEIRSAQRLRYRVFVEEMQAEAAGADHASRLEMDAFDDVFDHLILIDHAAPPDDPLDQVVAVYRLMTGKVAMAAKGFYGASEYNLDLLEGQAGRCVELGRSCVREDYRGGLAMHVMWNGLAEYVLSRNIEILFGVASFHGTNPASIAPALSHLYHAHLAPPDLRVTARPEHRVAMEILAPDQYETKLALQQIPSLIKAYLRLGGFVGDGAYIDHDFNTIDVCLVMDTTRMKSRYRDFYRRNAS